MIHKNGTIPQIDRALNDFAWARGVNPLPTNAQLATIPPTERDFIYVKNYGWALPTQELITTVLKHVHEAGMKKLLSLGAGGACTERLFQLAGLDVVATDKSTLMDGAYMVDDDVPYARGRFCMNVEQLNAKDALIKYPHHAIFVSWPSDEKMFDGVADALTQKHIAPNTPIFVVDPLQTWCQTNLIGNPQELGITLVEECPLALHPDRDGHRSYLHVLKTLG